MNITIAGSSGYIGKNLIKKIDNNFLIKGLSRTNRISDSKNIKWVETDLFSLNSTIEALKETDIAIYLVHSMLPSSHLFQGSFQDSDLLLADNFARACQKANVKQILYLGGLVPDSNISKHLASRKEVEDIFKATNIPLTILRAGMVVGDYGSSFEILKNLVFNLPMMVLPYWTKSQTQAIYIDDLIRIINLSINNQDFFNKTLDVINGEKLTYRDLIKQTADHFNKKTLLIPVSINYTSFSKLWVKLFGEADYELVSPLIDSLLCDLSHSKIDPLIEGVIKFKRYRNMLTQVSNQKIKKTKTKVSYSENTVRSIQRLPNTLQFDSKTISQKYISWLPAYFKSIIKVKQDNDIISFVIFDFPLLVLKRIDPIDNVDRIKFNIIGGILTKTTNTGWLEFRRITGGNFTLASIHGFIPSLPWYIYKYTQAPLHKFVMISFGNYINTIHRT